MPDTPLFAADATNQSMPDATVIPVLQYPDVSAATAWLCQVFGFRERLRIGHHRAQLAVGRGAIVVVQGPPDLSPEQLAAASVMVRVTDLDAHYRVASAAGARILGEPATQPYGERQYSAADLAGRAWTFSESVANVDPSSWGGLMVTADSRAV
jgi:uncharacterized glyoxalase superfamily protein PhnB